MSGIASSYPPRGSVQRFEYLSRKPDDPRPKALLKEASEYFNGLSLKSVDCSFDRRNPPKNAAALLQEIYETKRFQGLCVGELHNEQSSKKFIIKNVKLLKDLGVTTLYLEHLESDTMQEDLDNWSSGEEALSQNTRDFLKSLDERYALSDSEYSFTNLVTKVKEAGLRIVAIDSSIAAKAGVHSSQPTNAKSRIKAMNYVAEKVMTADEDKREGKYIVLTGQDHGTILRNSAIPGISELMQCPFLVVADAETDREPDIILNPLDPYQLGYLNIANSVHAILTMSNPTAKTDNRPFIRRHRISTTNNLTAECSSPRRSTL